MTKSAGIDIGSRTVKVVLVEDGKLKCARKAENSYDPRNVCRELLGGLEYDEIVATGYGRHLFKDYFACRVVSEISAFAYGARALFGSCRAVLDIGGQDTKAISLDDAGKLHKFEMNDKCAAGTGRFLEIMAMALGYSLDEFAAAALTAEKAEHINSMCTVFAESEVISLTARGAVRPNVALGIHHAIGNRSAAMLKRVGIEGDVVFAGGVALNSCMQKLISEAVGKPLLIPDDPQIIGALGCALMTGIKGKLPVEK